MYTATGTRCVLNKTNRFARATIEVKISQNRVSLHQRREKEEEEETRKGDIGVTPSDTHTTTHCLVQSN
jgi:hypothetical protein